MYVYVYIYTYPLYTYIRESRFSYLHNLFSYVSHAQFWQIITNFCKIISRCPTVYTYHASTLIFTYTTIRLRKKIGCYTYNNSFTHILHKFWVLYIQQFVCVDKFWFLCIQQFVCTYSASILVFIHTTIRCV